MSRKSAFSREVLLGVVSGLLAVGLAQAAEPLTVRLHAEDGEPAVPEVRTALGGVAQVSVPEMVVHLPKKEEATGLAVIVCPGGSYREVGAFDDGMRTVPYFVPKGVAVIVLKYRTRPPSKDVINDALADAKRVVRMVRHRAGEWNIDPHRIGMIGSSAGSHLILNLGTHWDMGDHEATDEIERESCRPDFMALLCPWPNRQPADDFPITKETPPMFVASARDDTIAPIEFSKAIVEAAKKNGVAVEFWELDKGGHTAFGQKLNPAYHWPERLTSWLKEVGVWKKQIF